MIEIIKFKENFGFLDHKNKIAGFLRSFDSAIILKNQTFKTNYEESYTHIGQWKTLIIYED